MPAVAFRKDINGLRALAVLSVIAFHAMGRWCPGGFLGVDVFFVISGFLISKSIETNLQDSSFSFLEFYRRRILRILPAMFFVMMVSLLIGYVLLLPKDYETLTASLRAATYFIANVYFAKEGGYFDISADEKPLLHLWSLSVEEQFYFFWPVLLFAAIACLCLNDWRSIGMAALSN